MLLVSCCFLKLLYIINLLLLCQPFALVSQFSADDILVVENIVIRADCSPVPVSVHL